MGTFYVFQFFGDEVDPATNPAGAVATASSAGTAPTNGALLRGRTRSFDQTTDQTLQFDYILPANYSSGGSLSFHYSTAATSGNVIFKTAYVLLNPGTTDWDAASFGTVTAGAANAVPATAGIRKLVTIDLGVTGGVAGYALSVMFGRDADNASDTVNANTVLLHQPWILSGTTV